MSVRGDDNLAVTKIHSINSTVVRTLAYISNDNKTENGKFVKTYLCSKDPDIAEKEFLEAQELLGTGRNKTLAKHMIMSFKPGEVTPEKALELGEKLCEKLLKNQYQYMLAVHTDRQHIHCHIVFNNVNLENGKSFTTLSDRKNKVEAWKQIHIISDDICKESGLSVIKNSEKNKGKSYYEWDMNRQGISWKSKLKYELDECISQSDNFEDFFKKVREKNIEVVYNPKHKIDLKFRMDGQQKWSRARTLGWYYETPQIRKRIEQSKIFRTGEYGRRQRIRIIDTSTEKMQANKGLERWADIQNMKEASRMINMLTELGVSSTNEIEDKSLQSFGKRVELIKKLNDMQHKIDELSDCIANVRAVRKYKPIKSEYKAIRSPFERKRYADKNSSALDKYSKANANLKSLFPDGQVPSERELTEQRNALIESRKALNSEYKKLLQDIKNLDYARQTIRDYLQNEREQKQHKGDLE